MYKSMYLSSNFLQKVTVGAGGMAQQIKVLAALAEDGDSIASTHLVADNCP